MLKVLKQRKHFRSRYRYASELDTYTEERGLKKSQQLSLTSQWKSFLQDHISGLQLHAQITSGAEVWM